MQSKIVPDLLSRGLINPVRFAEIQGDTLLEKVLTAVDLYRKGKVSGERLIFRVAKD